MKHLESYNEFPIINEASFFSISHDDILTDKYITDIIKTEDFIDHYLERYIEINDLTEDENEVRNSHDFREHIENGLRVNLEEASSDINSMINHDGMITIYRMMRVDGNWITHLKSQGKRLGIFWSWEKDAADAHWGEWNSPVKNNTAIIEVSINEKYVDWIDTFELNIHPYYSDEKEIRLFKNTPLNIKSISIDGESVDISSLDDKIFKS